MLGSSVGYPEDRMIVVGNQNIGGRVLVERDVQHVDATRLVGGRARPRFGWDIDPSAADLVDAAVVAVLAFNFGPTPRQG